MMLFLEALISFSAMLSFLIILIVSCNYVLYELEYFNELMYLETDAESISGTAFLIYLNGFSKTGFDTHENCYFANGDVLCLSEKAVSNSSVNNFNINNFGEIEVYRHYR